MKNRLFIVCPFSNLELFLNKKYGENIYFISSPGAVSLFREHEYLMAIKGFIEDYDINSIYIVNDTSCQFINKVIKRDANISYNWEQVMEEIYIANKLEHFSDFTSAEHQHSLASLNINNIAKELLTSEVFKDLVALKKIVIRGLVTSKEKNQLQEIKIHHLNRNSYEF